MTSRCGEAIIETGSDVSPEGSLIAPAGRRQGRTHDDCSRHRGRLRRAVRRSSPRRRRGSGGRRRRRPASPAARSRSRRSCCRSRRSGASCTERGRCVRPRAGRGGQHLALAREPADHGRRADRRQGALRRDDARLRRGGRASSRSSSCARTSIADRVADVGVVEHTSLAARGVVAVVPTGVATPPLVGEGDRPGAASRSPTLRSWSPPA